ncbi:MAG: acyl-CoA/acyl-ACP dehydrogenase [Blastocatellia bacterium]|nr:acyl-CoA/acyl-ACP dehydrogenase [Blastocatellia bacterium]
MEFDLNEDQKVFRDTTRKLLKKECPAERVRRLMETDTAQDAQLWHLMAEQGWLGLTLPEDFGGLGQGLVELAVIAEEMGRVCLPGGFLSAIFAGALVAEAGNSRQKAAYLEKMASGDLKGTVALLEAEADWNPSAVRLAVERNGEDFVVSGKKLFVPDAQTADVIFCVVRDGESLALLPVAKDAAGVKVTAMPALDATRKLYQVEFENVAIPQAEALGADGNPERALRRAIEVATVTLCAEMVGGMQWVLETAVEYAKTRHQFGKPIGSFQAVQHQCADMLLLTESSRSATLFAAWALTVDDPKAAAAVSIAKAYCSDAFREVCHRGVQVHGGIGFTWEYDLQLYVKRSKASEILFGDATFHREQVAQLVLGER